MDPWIPQTLAPGVLAAALVALVSLAASIISAGYRIRRWIRAWRRRNAWTPSPAFRQFAPGLRSTRLEITLAVNDDNFETIQKLAAGEIAKDPSGRFFMLVSNHINGDLNGYTAKLSFEEISGDIYSDVDNPESKTPETVLLDLAALRAGAIDWSMDTEQEVIDVTGYGYE